MVIITTSPLTPPPPSCLIPPYISFRIIINLIIRKGFIFDFLVTLFFRIVVPLLPNFGGFIFYTTLGKFTICFVAIIIITTRTVSVIIITLSVRPLLPMVAILKSITFLLPIISPSLPIIFVKFLNFFICLISLNIIYVIVWWVIPLLIFFLLISIPLFFLIFFVFNRIVIPFYFWPLLCSIVIGFALYTTAIVNTNVIV